MIKKEVQGKHRESVWKKHYHKGQTKRLLKKQGVDLRYYDLEDLKRATGCMDINNSEREQSRSQTP